MNCLKQNQYLWLICAAHTQGKLVKPEDSAEVLAKLLLDDGFESGAHIDYFEIK